MTEREFSSKEEKYQYYLRALDLQMEKMRTEGEERRRSFTLLGIGLGVVFALGALLLAHYLRFALP